VTRWVEVSLRQQGQPWPGLNTRGGRLDPGAGFLAEGSVNAFINVADLLEKRRGFIRGIDERFNGVVCGLFRYTDECGVEYLVVADQSGIQVREPFDIPTFLGSDSFPIDNFETLDTTRWSNTTDYDISNQALILNSLAAASSAEYVESTRLMQWFKEAVLSSYQVEIEYAMGAGLEQQVAAVVIKRAITSFIQANVLLNGSTYKVTLQLVVAGVRSTLMESNLDGATAGDGFMKLSFDSVTRTATVRVVPIGGSIVTISKQISEIQANALGQHSAIGLAYSATGVLPVAIRSVTGGAI
jgi:hypothetical protein